MLTLFFVSVVLVAIVYCAYCALSYYHPKDAECVKAIINFTLKAVGYMMVTIAIGAFFILAIWVGVENGSIMFAAKATILMVLCGTIGGLIIKYYE